MNVRFEMIISYEADFSINCFDIWQNGAKHAIISKENEKIYNEIK